MLNEDLLVERLENIGFVEIFAENLSTNEKSIFLVMQKLFAVLLVVVW